MVKKDVLVKYLAFVLLILFSLNSNASNELIDELELTEVEYNRLGFLKVVNSSDNEPNSPSQVLLTYPKKFKSNFIVSNVFLEVRNDKGIILETWLNIEDAGSDLLSSSTINLIDPTAISISVSIKYIKYDSGASISTGHLINLGNLNLFPATTYSNYQQWKVSP